MKLILASASPRRAEILRDAGISFSVISSAVDETPFPNESPHEHVLRLAAAKAELVAARAVGPAIVIAADTVITLDGRIIGKPRSTEDARRTLEQFASHTHSVLTGVTLIRLPDLGIPGLRQLARRRVQRRGLPTGSLAFHDQRRGPASFRGVRSSAQRGRQSGSSGITDAGPRMHGNCRTR